jgi:hypothetical protein
VYVPTGVLGGTATLTVVVCVEALACTLSEGTAGVAVALGTVVFADKATVRLPSVPAGARFWIPNATVAVSPWPTVTVSPARTPMSLTGVEMCVAGTVCGESKQT